MEELRVRQLWPRPCGRLFISPFEASEDFSQDCWQASEALATSPTDRYYSFTQDAEEVVRMLIVDGRGPVDSYYSLPMPIEDMVEIYFIETAHGRRHGHLATTAIHLLRMLYPNRGLVAFADGQQGFWEALGWYRCESTSPGRPALYLSR